MNIKYINGNRIYEPTQTLVSNSFEASNFKPGLLEQISAFTDFCEKNIPNSLLTSINEGVQILIEIEKLISLTFKVSDVPFV